MPIGGRKKTVEIDFIADTTKATQGIKKVGDTAETEGTRLQKMGDKAKLGFAAAAVGVGIAIDFLKDATLAAAEDERAQADLALALKNTVDATDDQIEATEEWIKKTSLATGVADDELRPALEALTRATGDLDEAQDLLAVAMDISAATGKPLQTVIEAMSKAIQNNSIGALGRLGLKVKDVEGNFLTFDEVMQEAQRTMGGAMETAAQTGEGAVNRLRVRFEETKEELGSKLIPVLIIAADAVTDFFETLERPINKDELDAYTRKLVELDDNTAPIDKAMQGLGDSFKALGDLIGIYTIPPVAALSRETQDARRLGIDPATGAIDDLSAAASSARSPIENMGGAAGDAGGAAGDAAAEFYEMRDAVAALHDPVFGLYDAQQDLAKATDDARVAAEEFGEGSPEHVDALGGVRDAALKVQSAEATLASQTGVTRSTMETHLRALRVFTEEQIQLMLDEFERINAFKFDTKSITLVRRITGGGPQEQHVGGVVQGDFPGQVVPVLARAGEPFGSAVPSNNGHAQPVAVTVNVNGRKFFEEVVVPEMAKYQRRNGTVLP